MTVPDSYNVDLAKSRLDPIPEDVLRRGEWKPASVAAGPHQGTGERERPCQLTGSGERVVQLAFDEWVPFVPPVSRAVQIALRARAHPDDKWARLRGGA